MQVITVNTPGPQGPTGPQGPSGSVDTSSFVTISLFNSFTSSYNTGSFLGNINGTSSYSETASFAQILTLQAYDPLPSSPPGTIAVSASSPLTIYFYDGSNWNSLY